MVFLGDVFTDEEPIYIQMLLFTDLQQMREFQNLTMTPDSKHMIETVFIGKFFPLKIAQRDIIVDRDGNALKGKSFDVTFYREEQRLLGGY